MRKTKTIFYFLHFIKKTTFFRRNEKLGQEKRQSTLHILLFMIHSKYLYTTF